MRFSGVGKVAAIAIIAALMLSGPAAAASIYRSGSVDLAYGGKAFDLDGANKVGKSSPKADFRMETRCDQVDCYLFVTPGHNARLSSGFTSRPSATACRHASYFAKRQEQDRWTLWFCVRTSERRYARIIMGSETDPGYVAFTYVVWAS